MKVYRALARITVEGMYAVSMLLINTSSLLISLMPYFFCCLLSWVIVGYNLYTLDLLNPARDVKS